MLQYDERASAVPEQAPKRPCPPLLPWWPTGVAIAGFSTENPVAAFEDGELQWLSTVTGKPVAIGGSVVCAVGDDDVDAYDARGSAGCSGAPTTCSPLWSAPGTDAIIANGTLYVSTTNASGSAEIAGYGLP